MSNTKAFAVPKQAGEKLSAAEINKIDDGQARAVVNDGTTFLNASCSVVLGNNTFAFAQTGVGSVQVPSDSRFVGTAWPSLDARSVPSHCPLTTPSYTTGDYEEGPGLSRQLLNSTFIRFPFVLPVGATITAAKIGFKKTSGTLPSAKPQVALFYFDYTSDPDSPTPGGTQVGTTAVDPSTTAAAYQIYHLVGPSGLSHVVASGRVYFLGVQGDNNAAGGNYLNVYRPVISLSMTSLRTV